MIGKKGKQSHVFIKESKMCQSIEGEYAKMYSIILLIVVVYFRRSVDASVSISGLEGVGSINGTRR